MLSIQAVTSTVVRTQIPSLTAPPPLLAPAPALLPAQAVPWVLDDPSTYRSSTTHWVDPDAVQDRFGVNFRRNVNTKRRAKRRASVTDGMVIEAALFSARRWTVPEPGQVWVRIRRAGDMRQRRDAALHQRLPDPCG